MKRALTAVVLIPLVLLVVFKAPLWVFVAVTAIFGVLTSWEYLEIAAKYESATPARQTISLATLLSILAIASVRNEYLDSRLLLAGWALALLLLFPFALLAWQLRASDFRSAVAGSALAFFVVPYVWMPFVCLVDIQAMHEGWFFTLLLFLLVWSGDIFAYYVGKNFGKRLLAPRVSPKKTWEGTVASVVGSAGVSFVICLNAANIERALHKTGVLASASVFGDPASLQSPPLWVPLLLAVCINVAAQLGDLAESMLKRGVDVKDSGTILPGHGGLLDRVDALLFAAPVGMLLFQVTRHYFYTR